MSIFIYIYSVIVSSVALVHIHIHYSKNWLVTFVSCSILYLEICAMINLLYAKRFLEEGLLSGIYDIVYYMVVFALYIFCGIFSVRTFEYGERQKFYGSYRQHKETKECEESQI